MKSHLKLIKIKHGTDEWLQFRLNGIGGSEASTVLGINRYDTSVRLFYEKLGTVDQKKQDNQRMQWGRVLEEEISQAWRYYDGSKEGYVENRNNDKIVRNCRNVNGYVVNPKYPWLFASVDRLINIDGGFNLITGEPLTEEAVLECKNLSYWSAQAWEDGIPIYFLVQVHVYMIIFETNYAEIAMLVDGGDFRVELVEYDTELGERILSITKSFWNDRVLPAKKALENRNKAEIDGNMVEYERWDAEIQRLEPDPDGSEAYEEYMQDQFVKERAEVEGNIQMLNLAKQDRFYMSMKSRIDKERTYLRNQFVKFISQAGAESINFGNFGRINWSERKGSKNKSFGNAIKDKPSEDFIDEQFDKLDYEY